MKKSKILYVLLFLGSCAIGNKGPVQIGLKNKISFPEPQRYYSYEVIIQNIYNIETTIEQTRNENVNLENSKKTIDMEKSKGIISTPTYEKKKLDLQKKKTENDNLIRNAQEGKKAWEALKKSQPNGYLKKIQVSNGQELLSALQNNCVIILKSGEYEIKPYDIEKLTNVTIIGEGSTPIHLVSNDLSNPVFCFIECSSITLKNLKLGHKKANIYKGNIDFLGDVCGGPMISRGSVISLINCGKISIDNCYLYGCGTYGLYTSRCLDICINSTHIYKCSHSALCMNDTKNTTLESCQIYNNSDIKEDLFNFSFCDKIYLENTGINFNNSKNIFINTYESKNIFIRNCLIQNNKFSKYTNTKNIVESEEISLNNNIFD